MARPRSSSFSSTPTFSSDLQKLRTSTNNPNGVSSYAAAIEIARQFDVLCSSHSPLARKVVLEKEGDWIGFFERAGCVSVVLADDDVNDTSSTAANTAEDGASSSSSVKIDLEKFLRHCFDIAYKMPSSPNVKHLRSGSQGVPPVPVGSPGGSNAGNSRRTSPPQLSI